MDSALVRLAKLLSELYPDQASSVQVMQAAGINAGRVHAEQQPRTRWHFIVDEARKASQIPALLATAIADYPDSVDLRLVRVQMGLSVALAKRLKVLAIWPVVVGMAQLDTKSEAAALYDVGIDYVALKGDMATRDGVVREWQRLKPDIVQIDTHGEDGLIYLSDGATRPGWWGRLVREHAPQLMVLLACDSSQQDMFDIPDALLREGVQAVIAVSDEIEDVDAVRFAKSFYESYTAPMSIAEAVERAKLTLSDSGADMIRLRERE